MKKLFLLLNLLIPTLSLADYYDVQWQKVAPSTTTPSTSWSYRGNMYVVTGDTTTAALISNCTAYIKLFSTGTIECLNLIASTATISGVITGTATYTTNAGLLDGLDSLYFLSCSSAAATYLQLSSAAATYLTKIGKAADSDLLDGNDSTYFLSESSAVATYLQKSGGDLTGSIGVPVASKYYLDTTSGNDYITAAANNIVQFFTSGTKRFEIGTSSITFNVATYNVQDTNIRDTYLTAGSIIYLDGSDDTIFSDGTNLKLSAGGNVNLQVQPSAIVAAKTISETYGISAATGTFSGAVTAATLDTGQGANELYAMDQNVQTTDIPTFNTVNLTYGISGATSTINKLYPSQGIYTDAIDGNSYMLGTSNDMINFYTSGSQRFQVGTSSVTVQTAYLKVGDAGAVAYIDGDGDLYVEDELEVDGDLYTKAVYFWNTGEVSASAMLFYDNVEVKYGDNSDFSLGYSSTDDELRIVRGADVTIDNNTAFRVLASTNVVIGESGTINYATGQGDLYVQDALEVDGSIRSQGNIYSYSSLYIMNSAVDYLGLRTSVDDGALLCTGSTFDGQGNKNFIITTYANSGTNHGHSTTSDDPTLFIHSSKDPAIDNTQWISLSYSSATDRGVIDVGSSGYLYIPDYVVIGTTDTMNSIEGQGDLYIQDELEVDGTSRFDNVYAKTFIDLNAYSAFLALTKKTEAELKALVPNDEGLPYYDSTNKAVVISTGTAAGSFGLIYDGTQLPIGW